MKIFIFLTLYIVNYIGWGQITPPYKPLSHLSDNGLRGKVKTFKTTPYKIIDNFGKIEKGEKVDFWKGDAIITFNEKGYKISTDRYDKSGNILQKIIYTYDEINNRITRDVYDSSGKINLKFVYIYNEKNQKIAYNSYRTSGELVESYAYKNDEKGREIEEITMKSSLPWTKYTYQYDNKNNIIQFCKYVKKGEEPEACEEYIYDKKGRKSEILFFKKNTLISKTIITYDDFDNEINHKIYDDKNIFIEEKEFKYKYDNHKNWIERIEYINKFARQIIIREITYY